MCVYVWGVNIYIVYMFMYMREEKELDYSSHVKVRPVKGHSTPDLSGTERTVPIGTIY